MALLLMGDPAGIRLRQGYGVTGASIALQNRIGSAFESNLEFFARIAIRCLHGKPRKWRNTARAYLVQAPACHFLKMLGEGRAVPTAYPPFAQARRPSPNLRSSRKSILRTQSGRDPDILFRTPRKRPHEHQTNTTNNSERPHNYDSMKPCKRVMSAGA
jgi:hypothetical protein